METYVENQAIFNTIINKIITNNTSVGAYILVCNSDKLLNKTSNCLSKALICPNKYQKNCNNCNICKQIDNLEYPELKIIKPVNNNIKKSDVLELRNEFQTLSLNGKNRVYIINHAEYLGVSAANSILKFLEEPEGNVVGIFTTNNLSGVLETIKSRCQIIKLNNVNSKQGLEYVKEYCLCDDVIIEKALDFAYIIENNEDDLLVKIDDINTQMDSKEKLLSFFNVLLLIYMDKLNKIIFEKINYFNNSDKFDSILINDKNLVISRINIILKNIQKLRYNVNSVLFLANFVIELKEGN